MFDRKAMSEKYYINWKPKYDIYKIKDKSDEVKIECYKEYRQKLIEFINEIDSIAPTVTKISFKPNFRQTGGYERCVLKYYSPYWKDDKPNQFESSYKELMIDFLYYSDGLEYDEISLDEIQIIKKMAYFLICQAEINIYELRNK